MGTRSGIVKPRAAPPQPDLTLSSCDLTLINAAQDDLHRLARALLLIWARANLPGATHPAQVPEAQVVSICAQLGIDPAILADDKNPLVFHHADLKAVQGYLHLRSLTADDTARLRIFLAEQVPQTANSLELIQAAYCWMAEQQILPPIAKTVVQRLVYQVRHETEERLFQSLAEQLSDWQREQLDELCQARQGRSMLATLVMPPHTASTDAVREEAQRLKLIRASLPADIDWMGIQPARLWQWAAIVRRLSAQALRRYPPAKRYALLLAFLTVRGPEITDTIVEMFDTLIARLFARSNAELREAQMEQAQSQLSSARLFRRITQVLLDAKVPSQTVRDHIFQQISREQIQALVKRSESLEEGEAEALFALLKSRFNQARELARVTLQALQFCSADVQSPVLAGIRALRLMDAERRKKVPKEAPLAFVPQRWLRVVATPDGIDRRAWELALLYQMRQALRSGDLTVEGSRNYAPWPADLYSLAEWSQRRAAWFERGLPEQGEEYLAQARAELHALTTKAAERLLDHPAIQVKEGKLQVMAQDRLQTPQAAPALRRALGALLPRVGLPELLQEVEGWTNFTAAFEHLTARREPTPRHQEAIHAALLAVLVAEATNVGLTAMSAASGIPHGQLVRVYDWYLREETLREAIGMLIAFHQTLPLTSAFGTGTISSSSESEFARLISGPQAHYRGARSSNASRKVIMYSHVSDQATQFWIDLVNPLAQGANYALDGLVAQHLLPICEHMAAIPGNADLLFGLFELLGYRLTLPLPELAGQPLARAQEGVSYGILGPALTQTIHDSIISTQWETLNRLAASCKDHLVRPSVILPKLQNMHEEAALRQALQEVGRIARTRSLLTFITDDSQLQRVLAGQHRSASIDAMARAIFFGQQGRLSDRDPAAQLRRALALSLVINAIIVWNTRYLEVAAQESARRGQPVPEEMWPHLHPIMWEHIHLVGAYCFDHDERRAGHKNSSHSEELEDELSE